MNARRTFRSTPFPSRSAAPSARIFFVTLVALMGCHVKSTEPVVAYVVDSGVGLDGGGGLDGGLAPLPSMLMVEPRAVDLAIYLPVVVPPAVLSAAQDDARKRFPGLKILTKPTREAHASGLFVFAPDVERFRPPSQDQLDYVGRGLDAGLEAKAAESKGVVIVALKLVGDPRFERLREVQKFAYDVAQKNAGFVWDETTRQLYTVDSWKAARINGWEGDVPDMRHDVTIHYYETDGGRHRAITLGMVKFGLPDLVVADVPPSTADAMTSLMNAAAQTLVEGGSLGPNGELAIDLKSIRHTAVRSAFTASAAKGAPQRGTVRLISARAETGDPDNRLAEMRFDSYRGKTDTDRQADALAAIMGASTGTTTAAPDPEMAAAIARAQARVPDLAAAFRKGLPRGEHMLVKARFDDDEGGYEWLWIGVSSWQDDIARGTLVKDPKRISALKFGSKVEATKSEIADYLWLDPNGKKKEGGETEEILERRDAGSAHP